MNQDADVKECILIVDDEPLVRDILSRRLKDQGYQCVTAADGFEAIEKMRSGVISLVLLDINMPKKSGMDVLKDIQANYEDTITIMITAVADIKIAIDAMRSGAYDYIIKPIDLDILSLTAERALDKRRLLLENKRYRLYLEEKVQEQTNKIRDSFLNSIKSLALALEAKDYYTHGHSERTTQIALAIAAELNVSKEGVDKIRLAGLLHDIGKIGVKGSILDKPGKLTFEEYNMVKAHPDIGTKILTPIIDDEEILDIVRHHHERYDGNGYPDGLSAKHISLYAKIMAVADSYDAMTTDRPYRKALSPEVVRTELEKGRGTQWDPQVVDTLFKVEDKLEKVVSR